MLKCVDDESVKDSEEESINMHMNFSSFLTSMRNLSANAHVINLNFSHAQSTEHQHKFASGQASTVDSRVAHNKAEAEPQHVCSLLFGARDRCPSSLEKLMWKYVQKAHVCFSQQLEN